jgi:hypothetical protein
LHDRDNHGALLEPAHATKVVTSVADALIKLRASRLAEVEALSALVEALVDMRGGRDSCDAAGRVAPQSGQPTASPASTPEQSYLSVQQLADRIPYAEHTIRNLMTTGALREGEHYFKRRGRVMFSWPAMCRWVEECGSLAAETLPMVRSRRRGR